jgi:outer membrane protein OmpA-like peptidoglycan-associated protein
MKSSRIIKNVSLFIALAGASEIIGCAAALPPPELVDARQAYDRASQGPTQRLNPAGVHVARTQLDIAEASFKENGDTRSTRDYAYVALRQSERAESVARARQSSQATEGVVDSMHADQTHAVAQTSAALDRTKSALATQGVVLADERSRREDAEKRAAQAAADLAKFATVKQEPRGMVITLSGGVLFASAKSALLPGAREKLNDVANALTKEDPDSKIIVEGHTDSQGAAEYNQELSEHRAQTVRDYLVTRGVASDRITAQGFGQTRSVADNASPEGRANNRRVEIVVQPTAQ